MEKKGRKSHACDSRCAVRLCLLFTVANSTKAIPFLRPVSMWTGMRTVVMAPNSSKNAFTSDSSASKLRPPTKIVLLHKAQSKHIHTQEQNEQHSET